MTMKIDNKIKVMRIFSRLNIGGPSIHTILLTSGLNKKLFNSILVVGKEGPNEGKTALMAAAQNGHENVVALLIENRADVNAKNKVDKTPLKLANGDAKTFLKAVDAAEKAKRKAKEIR